MPGVIRLSFASATACIRCCAARGLGSSSSSNSIRLSVRGVTGGGGAGSSCGTRRSDGVLCSSGAALCGVLAAGRGWQHWQQEELAVTKAAPAAAMAAAAAAHAAAEAVVAAPAAAIAPPTAIAFVAIISRLCQIAPRDRAADCNRVCRHYFKAGAKFHRETASPRSFFITLKRPHMSMGPTEDLSHATVPISNQDTTTALCGKFRQVPARSL